MGSVWLGFATLVLTIKRLQRKPDKFNAVWNWVTVCAWCKKTRDSEGAWQQPQPMLHREGVTFSHGICPVCAKQAYNASRSAATSAGELPPSPVRAAPLAAASTNIESTSRAAAP
jgi:hypothetical protein